MNEKIKKAFLALMMVSFFSGAFADDSQAGQSAEALATPPTSLPRITNTIVRQNHRPIAMASNLPPPAVSATSLSAKLANADAWPEPMPSQLVVMASRPLVTGEKTVVKLAMKNGLSEKIESARATIFLLDDQGKVVGQPTTRWVVGGSENKPGLASGAANSFLFVITDDKAVATTNLTAKVAFNRIVLDGGKVGDTERDVLIQKAK